MLKEEIQILWDRVWRARPRSIFALDPVALFFGQVAISAKAPSPNAAKLAANFMLSQECQQFLAKFGRLPTRSEA